MTNSIEDLTDNSKACIVSHEIEVTGEDGDLKRLEIPTSKAFSVLVGISSEELDSWKQGYEDDNHYSLVLESFCLGGDKFPQYHYSDIGLLYFEDALGHDRLCVPENRRKALMEEVHETITETAHAGYHKTYNKLTVSYYWPTQARRGTSMYSDLMIPIIRK